MNIFEKLAARAAQPPQDNAVAGFGTVSGVPAGIGSLGGAADVKRTARTHTGQVPTDFVTPVAVDETQRRIVAMAASVLLRYPEEDFLSHLDVVQDQLEQLPMALATDFMGFIDAARTAGLRALQEHYVETFDQRRRCSLFLSYYAVGDTRQRGMAILSFSQQLESFGFQLAENELPDHLCVVLEALGLAEGEDHARAVEMLASYREGIEVLRAALSQQDSPYVRLIVAVCKALPEIDAETAQKYVDLIRTGPPAEMVGIADLPFPTAQPDLV